MTEDKPPVLKNPRRLLKLLGVLLGVFVLLYVGVAATAFLRSQGSDDQRPMTGDTQAPVEAAHPEPLVYRPKRGFGPPMARWLAGPLRDWAEALLDPQLLRNQGCFDAARVRGIWEAFLRGERKWHTHLWNVLMFQAWHQHWHVNRGR